MHVRYKPAWGLTLLTLGALAAGIGGVVLAMGGRPHWGTFTSGAIALIAGFGFYRRDYFRIADGELQVPAAIGPLVKRYPLEAPGDLTVQDGKLAYRGKTLGLSPTMARAEQWQAALQHVRTLQQAEVFD